MLLAGTFFRQHMPKHLRNITPQRRYGIPVLYEYIGLYIHAVKLAFCRDISST